MEMPKPTDAHRKLSMLDGNWKGEETLFPSPWDPKGGTAVGIAKNRTALDGFAVIHDYAQERGGAVTYQGHGIFGFDAKKNEYIMYWFDSMGTPLNEFRGKFEGNVLSMVHKGEMGQSRAIFDFSAPGKYTFKMDMSQDGAKWMPMMEGRYAKQK
jgi:hypothetical protein